MCRMQSSPIISPAVQIFTTYPRKPDALRAKTPIRAVLKMSRDIYVNSHFATTWCHAHSSSHLPSRSCSGGPRDLALRGVGAVVVLDLAPAALERTALDDLAGGAKGAVEVAEARKQSTKTLWTVLDAI